MSHNVLPNAMPESTNPSNVGPSIMCPTSVHNESGDDDSNEDNNVVQEIAYKLQQKEMKMILNGLIMQMPMMSMLSSKIRI